MMRDASVSASRCVLALHHASLCSCHGLHHPPLFPALAFPRAVLNYPLVPLARTSIVFGRVLSALGLAGLDDHAYDDTPTNFAQGLNREDQHRSETDFSDFVRKFQQGEVFPYREQLRKNTGKLRLTASTLLWRHNARISTRKCWCSREPARFPFQYVLDTVCI